MPVNDTYDDEIIANREKGYDAVADNHMTFILGADAETLDDPEDKDGVEEEDSSDVLLEDRELTREEQEKIVDESAGKPAFEGGQKVEAAGSEFSQQIADPDLKRKIFKPGENAPEDKPFDPKDTRTREQKFGEIRQGGRDTVDVDSVIQPGGFLGGAGDGGEKRTVEFIKQVTVGAASDVLVNTLTLAEEGGQAIRDLEIPGANTPDGKPATFDDILKIFGLGGKVNIDAEKLEKSGGTGPQLARSIVGFVATMALVKGSTGAGLIVSGGAADLLAVDRDQNFATMINEMAELDPGITKTVVDFLDNTKTDSQTRKALNNVLEGLGLGGLTAATFKALKAAKKSGLKPVLNERGAIDLPGGKKPKRVVKAPAEVPPEDIPKWVNTEGRSIDIGERYSINWRTQAAPKAAKEIRSAQRLENAAKIQKDIVKLTNEEVAAQASKRMKLDPQGEYEKFINRDVENDPWGKVEGLISRKMADESSIHLFDLMNAVINKVPGADEEYLEHLAKSSFIEAKAQQHSAFAGSLTQSFNIDLGDLQLGTKQFRQDVDVFKENLPEHYDAMAIALKMRNTIERPSELKVMQGWLAKSIRTAKASGNAVIEAWINGLLSGLSTQVVNIGNNIITSMWMIPERALAAGISKVRTTVQGPLAKAGVEPGEALALSYGWFKGMDDGRELLWRNLKNLSKLTDVEVSALQKIENFELKAITAKKFGLEDEHPAGWLVNKVGEFVRTPGKGLMTFDEYMQGVGQRMELHRRGYLAALEAGFNGLPKKSKINGVTAAEFIDDYVKNPPPNAQSGAQQFGRYITFTRELDAAGKAVQSFREVHPMITFLLPFIRTPANIFKFLGERLPIAPVFSKKVRSEFAAGGARADLMAAKIAMGTSMLMWATKMGAEGRITGSDTLNPKMKKIRRELNENWQPNSIVLFNDNGTPKKYISLNRLEPIGGLFTIGAALGEMLAHLNEPDREELIASLVIILSEQMSNKTFIRGISEVGAGALKGDLEQPLKNFAQSFVPSIVAQVESGISPQRSDVKTPDILSNDPIDINSETKTMEAAHEVIRRFRARIPWLSEGEENISVYDYWGKPVVYEPSWGIPYISPIYQRTPTGDPVNAEIIRLQVPVTRVTNEILGVQLTRKQFEEYQIVFGEIKDPKTGLNLHDAMDDMINSTDYELKLTDGTDEFDGTRLKALKMLEQFYKKMAQKQMIGDFPGLAEAIKDTQERKKQALTDQDAAEKQEAPAGLGGALSLPQ